METSRRWLNAVASESIPRTYATATGAREQLRRAIENVVRSAIRYTQPSAEVEIVIRKQCAPVLSSVVISSTRSRPGHIRRTPSRRIFSLYYRITTINGRRLAGTSAYGSHDRLSDSFCGLGDSRWILYRR
jgi:hypothetical protein